MYTKIFIASLTLAIIAGLIATFTQNALAGTAIPGSLWIALATFLGGLLTSIWVCASSSTPARESRPARRAPAQRAARASSAPASSPAGGTSTASSASKETGSVKWFSPSKGFGFITRDNGEDIFVHFRSILGKGHRVLREGQRVEFAVTQGTKGLQAEEVNTLK